MTLINQARTLSGSSLPGTRKARYALLPACTARSIRCGRSGPRVAERQARQSPLNHAGLMTTLKIVSNDDGTLHKINIVQHSGRLEFDMAALDTPYEAPPA